MKFYDFSFCSDQVSDGFLTNGYVVCSVENKDGFNLILETIRGYLKNILEIPPNSSLKFCDLHNLGVSNINQTRLDLFNELNRVEWIRPTFYSCIKTALDSIVGNELVMQNRINLSIMMPDDGSSNIPLHADTHAGESAFQVVAWMPLTDVVDRNGVFILPSQTEEHVQTYWRAIEREGPLAAFEELSAELIMPEVKVGEILIFDSSLIHGSIPNPSSKTRFSLNTRFKSSMAPDGFGEKSLGPYYSLTTLKPATQRGLKSF